MSDVCRLPSEFERAVPGYFAPRDGLITPLRSRRYQPASLCRRARRQRYREGTLDSFFKKGAEWASCLRHADAYRQPSMRHGASC